MSANLHEKCEELAANAVAPHIVNANQLYFAIAEDVISVIAGEDRRGSNSIRNWPQRRHHLEAPQNGVDGTGLWSESEHVPTVNVSEPLLFDEGDAGSRRSQARILPFIRTAVQR
jgi:hypothetical protein